jgi:hypothetical protein
MNMHLNLSMPAVLDTASSVGLLLLLASLYGSVAVWAGARLANWLAPPAWHAVAWAKPEPGAAAERVAAAHWFGEPRPPVPPALQLSGVFAPGAPGEAGFAVAEADCARRPLMVGDMVDDWRVGRIAADGIELEHGSSRHFYPLPAYRAGPASAGNLPGDAEPLPDPAESGL